MYYKKAKTVKKWFTKKNGKRVKAKIRVNKPEKCSAVRRICIICKNNKISKLDKNYELKICKPCYQGGSTTPL